MHPVLMRIRSAYGALLAAQHQMCVKMTFDRWTCDSHQLLVISLIKCCLDFKPGDAFNIYILKSPHEYWTILKFDVWKFTKSVFFLSQNKFNCVFLHSTGASIKHSINSKHHQKWQLSAVQKEERSDWYSVGWFS